MRDHKYGSLCYEKLQFCNTDFVYEQVKNVFISLFASMFDKGLFLQMVLHVMGGKSFKCVSQFQVLKVGVTCTRYVSLINARPWVIHAYRNIKGRGVPADENTENNIILDEVGQVSKLFLALITLNFIRLLVC